VNLKGHTREIVLGGVLVALLFYFLMPAAPIEDTSSVDGDGTSPVIGGARTLLDAPDVDLALLTQQPGEYEGGGRNLFDYGRILPPPPSQEELDRLAREAEERRKREEEERLRREAEQEALRKAARERQAELAARRANQAPSEPAPPPKPIPPSFPCKFIGVLGESSNKIAIFLDDKDFLMAHEGETVKEDFRIVKIGYDTLQIGYTNPQFEEESRILQMGKD
jgi:hypothetical protein